MEIFLLYLKHYEYIFFYSPMTNRILLTKFSYLIYLGLTYI